MTTVTSFKHSQKQSPEIFLGTDRQSDRTDFQSMRDYNCEFLTRLTWDVTAIVGCLERISNIWATELGISGPQWTILMAISHLDQNEGVPVKEVSTLIGVDPSFVTTQSKILERKGLVLRTSSRRDARVVKLSLSNDAHTQLSSVGPRRENMAAYIVSIFSSREMKFVSDNLTCLKSRMEKARWRALADL
jgi:MarR family transcriptional regulator, organic hydroperoxide resistance regulator